MDAFVLIGSFFALMMLGVPIAYALGIASLVGAWWIDLPLEAVMIQLASGVNKFSLLAIPFFVLAGALMSEGGMSRRLVALASVLVGFLRGGLSLVNILASTFFGGISGSAVADTASIGSVLIPEMERKGYPRDFSTAVTVSGSVQAILIPPSHNAVIYSLALGGSGMFDPFFAPILGPASLYDCYGQYGWASSAYWSQCDPYNGYFFSRYPGAYNGYYSFYSDPRYFGSWYVPANPATGGGTPALPEPGFPDLLRQRPRADRVQPAGASGGSRGRRRGVRRRARVPRERARRRRGLVALQLRHVAPLRDAARVDAGRHVRDVAARGGPRERRLRGVAPFRARAAAARLPLRG